MGRFLLGAATLGRNLHAQCFMEHLRSVAHALRDIGHEVEYATEEAMRERPGRLILWGANTVSQDPAARPDPHFLETIPDDAIVFNSEQVSAVEDPSWFIQSWIRRRNFLVWDYAQSNVDALRQIGCDAILCPLGYHPKMETIPRAAEEDIDVLFYGTPGGPRREILDALDATGMNVARVFGVYGEERDALIARAKVVVNLHYYPRGVFEIFRCAHLFTNRKCVVTEDGGRDVGLEDLARRCAAYEPRDRVVERCRELVESPHRRAMVADRGYEEFKKVDLAENLRRALEAS